MRGVTQNPRIRTTLVNRPMALGSYKGEGGNKWVKRNASHIRINHIPNISSQHPSGSLLMVQAFGLVCAKPNEMSDAKQKKKEGENNPQHIDFSCAK